MTVDRCPACSGALAPWRRSPAAEADAGLVALRRCRACGTAVTDAPVPPDAHDAGAYADPRPRGSGAAAPLLAAFDRRRLALLRAAGVAPGARVLDVGAGRGRFVAHARAAGYVTRGLEPSSRGQRAAWAVHRLVLEPVGLDDADVAAGSQDAVVLWHVLEHLDDPGAALERVAGWLRPGGVLLVGVPNLASAQAALGGDRWYHLDLPRHRTHFSVTGLRTVLRRAGFAVEAERHVLAEHNPFGLWQSVVNRATRRPSYLFQLLKRNAALDPRDLAVTLAAVPLVPAAAVAELGAGLAGRGGTVAVVARLSPPRA